MDTTAVSHSLQSGKRCAEEPDFDAALQARGMPGLTRGQVTTLQVNVGKRCNMACHHCHVEASPKRTEIMSRAVAEKVIDVLAANPSIQVLDITGGAPELNPNFQWMVAEARRLERQVIDRCNLTILLEPGQEGLAQFLAEHQVGIVASLPCYSPKNVEQQRGKGVFGQSIEALGRLNALGYGHPGSALRLDLVYNPGGAFLPPAQAQLEADYRDVLQRSFGIHFHHLLTVTNMPIKRFADWLARNNAHESYMRLLVNHFNPATVSGLMCRSLLSVGWDGKLFDCDFNQMLELPLGARGRREAWTLWDLSTTKALGDEPINTGSHCFGCTAGAGSSCSGALEVLRDQ